MDLSISLITPELWRERGAQAFDEGLAIDAHDLNHHAAARTDWIRGYRLRQLEIMQRPITVQQLDQVSPP